MGTSPSISPESRHSRCVLVGKQSSSIILMRVMDRYLSNRAPTKPSGRSCTLKSKSGSHLSSCEIRILIWAAVWLIRNSRMPSAASYLSPASALASKVSKRTADGLSSLPRRMTLMATTSSPSSAKCRGALNCTRGASSSWVSIDCFCRISASSSSRRNSSWCESSGSSKSAMTVTPWAVSLIPFFAKSAFRWPSSMFFSSFCSAFTSFSTFAMAAASRSSGL
mmetsp:Transcript_63179/g.206167  ORF Transcript_63179/g.206167 Transcript_63179/m.206167 type:complete len:223 (+) Transcript_63179:1940-2608(+)